MMKNSNVIHKSIICWRTTPKMMIKIHYLQFMYISRLNIWQTWMMISHLLIFFYNPYMQSHGELKVGDMFHTKEDYVWAIKKFHMENFVNYIIDCTGARMYVILCRNELYMFWLTTSYRKRSDLWETSSMDPPHSCTTNNLAYS